jgi:hypothetical protein
MNPSLILFVALTVLLSGCALDLGQGGRFGAYGGPPQQKSETAEPAFSVDDISFGVRWFPTHVRYAPDSSHILVSLCHTLRPELCRIGKYFVASNEWEILPFEDKRTYRWPVYSPDGKEIAVSTGACDEQYRCDLYQHVLARMRPDGSRMEVVADITAKEMSFSPDGRKLIYWRLGGMGPKGRRHEFGNIYEMDWATGKERALTELMFPGNSRGRALFVEDGEAFVFFAQSGDGRFKGLHLVKVKDAPVINTATWKLHLLWPYYDESRFNVVAEQPFDTSTDGRLLFKGSFGWRQKAKQPAALNILPLRDKYANPDDAALARMGAPLFLRQPRSDAADELAFKADKPYDAALAPDLTRVAFLVGSPDSYHPTNKGLAIVEQGDVQPIYVVWPKLELKPGRHSAFQH